MSTAARQAPRPEPPRLFFIPRRAGGYSSFLERLAELYHLYPYGRSGLSGIVRTESERAAFVLTIVFCFDLLAWSMIWNAVLERGQLVFGPSTVFAVLIGLLFALVVFNFEQGFIASDWNVKGLRPRMKLAAATVLRIAVIAASAYATSQPLELLVFANDIHDRVHQERVWEEIVAQALEFQHIKEELAGGGSMKLPVDQEQASEKALEADREAKAVNDAQLSAARSARDAAEKSLTRLHTQVTTKQREYDAAVSGGNTETVKEARSDLKKAEDALAGANGRIKRLTEQVNQKETASAQLGAKVDGAEKDVGQKRQDVKEGMTDLRTQSKNLREWVRTLSLSRPDQHDIPSPYKDIQPFAERPYSFAEQRRVLDDLRYARPVERHNLTLVHSDVLQDELKLEDPKTEDEHTNGDREAFAAVANQLYWALFVVAIFIPAMGLLFKLIIHHRLADYYSEEYQAASGHPEAMHAIQTDEFLERRRKESGRDDDEDKYRGGHIL